MREIEISPRFQTNWICLKSFRQDTIFPCFWLMIENSGEFRTIPDWKLLPVDKCRQHLKNCVQPLPASRAAIVSISPSDMCMRSCIKSTAFARIQRPTGPNIRPLVCTSSCPCQSQLSSLPSYLLFQLLSDLVLRKAHLSCQKIFFGIGGEQFSLETWWLFPSSLGFSAQKYHGCGMIPSQQSRVTEPWQHRKQQSVPSQGSRPLWDFWPLFFANLLAHLVNGKYTQDSHCKIWNRKPLSNSHSKNYTKLFEFWETKL